MGFPRHSQPLYRFIHFDSICLRYIRHRVTYPHTNKLTLGRFGEDVVVVVVVVQCNYYNPVG